MASTAGDAYAAFHESMGLGYTKFHTMLNKLVSLRLIDADLTTTGVHGRSRTIKLRYGADDVLKCSALTAHLPEGTIANRQG